MDSLKELYKIGPGPSSSHTLGPQRACQLYKAEYGEQLHHVEVELYGSLSLTGKGHLIGLYHPQDLSAGEDDNLLFKGLEGKLSQRLLYPRLQPGSSAAGKMDGFLCRRRFD